MEMIFLREYTKGRKGAWLCRREIDYVAIGYIDQMPRASHPGFTETEAEAWCQQWIQEHTLQDTLPVNISAR
jgi:O-succinylbenzoate synthase